MKKLAAVVGVILVMAVGGYFTFLRGWIWERDFQYIRSWYFARAKYDKAQEEIGVILDAPSEEQKKRAQVLLRQAKEIAKLRRDKTPIIVDGDVEVGVVEALQWHGVWERVLIVEMANNGRKPLVVSDEYLMLFAPNGVGFTTRRGKVAIKRTTLKPGEALRGNVVITNPPVSLKNEDKEPMHVLYIDEKNLVRIKMGPTKGTFSKDPAPPVHFKSVDDAERLTKIGEEWFEPNRASLHRIKQAQEAREAKEPTEPAEPTEGETEEPEPTVVEEKPEEPPALSGIKVIGKVTVAVARAPIKMGDNVVSEVKQGEVLGVSHENANWYYVPSKKGWLYGDAVEFEPAK